MKYNIKHKNIINKENEFQIIPSNTNIKENKKIKPYEIINNSNFFISSNENGNNSFKDFQSFKIINNSNIYFYIDEMNTNKDKNILEINNAHHFCIIQENLTNNNNLDIDNYYINIPSSSNKNVSHSFNENDLKKENISNINLIKNKKNILLGKK